MADRKIGVNRGNAGKGRPKGAPNKTTALLKDAIIRAAENAGGGGFEGLVAYLERQALENSSSFNSLLGRVVPMQVDGNVTGEFSVQLIRREIVDPKNG